MQGKGRMKYTERIQLYAEAIKGSYEAGRISAIPTSMLIYWRLEKGKSSITGKPIKHCETCLWMSSHNPFTPTNIPILPKAGTNCLVNCWCSIIYKKSTPEEINKIIQQKGSSQKILARMRREGVIRK